MFCGQLVPRLDREAVGKHAVVAQTPNVGQRRKAWAPHLKDYNSDADDLLWGPNRDKGKALLGAVNYLSGKGMNVFSFLTFSLDGGDDNVFPHRLKVSVPAYEAVADNQRWNSGTVYKDRFDVSKMEQWDRVFNVNTKGSFMFCRECANNMMDNETKGAIVTVSSIMGRSAKNMTGAYAASKAAVMAFTKSLAKALASMDIRVNSVAPGMVVTDLYKPVEQEMEMESDSFVPWIVEERLST